MREPASESPNEAPSSYLMPGVDVHAVAAFFEAAAQLYRADPWNVVPGDKRTFAFTAAQLGLRDAAVLIHGDSVASDVHNERRGLVFFNTPAELAAYKDVTASAQDGEGKQAPPRLELRFVTPDALPDAAAHEAREHGWSVASKAAHPWLVFTDAEGTALAPNPDEVTLGEAASRALTAALEVMREQARAQPDTADAPFEHTLNVRTYDGFVDVTLRCPYAPTPVSSTPHRSLLAAFARATEGEELGEAERALVLEAATALMVAGREAGFEMETEEGIQAWLAHVGR